MSLVVDLVRTGLDDETRFVIKIHLLSQEVESFMIYGSRTLVCDTIRDLYLASHSVSGRES